MEDPEDLSFSRLELCTYRYLQQMAKSMGLPSNVKKVYLVKMIYAKKFSSLEEVNAIVAQIREERKQPAKTRKPIKRKKKGVQGTEISSTSNQSPPISLTPHVPDFITYPPSAKRTILKYQQHSNILHPTISKRTIESDRVLRSRIRQNYGIMNVNSVIGVIKAQNAMQGLQNVQESQYELSVAFQRQRPININECVMQRPINIGECVVQRPINVNESIMQRRGSINVGEPMVQRHRPINIGECVVQRHRPILDYRDSASQRQMQMDFEGMGGGERQLVPVIRRSNIASPQPAERQRRLSGIYPLKPPEKTTYQYTPSVGFRRQDGRISKINAVVQKLNERHNQSKVIARHNTPVLRIEKRNIVPKAVIPNSLCKITSQNRANYKIVRPTCSNSSTETARESSTDRENVSIENNNKNTETQRYATETANKYIEIRNYATENQNRYIESRNYATDTPNISGNRNNAAENSNRITENKNYTIRNQNRYTESRDYAAETSNITKSRNYAKHTPNITVSRKCAVENQNRSTKSRNYTTNRYTESRDFSTVTSNITESRDYATQTPNIKGSRNYATEKYPEIENYAANTTDRYTDNRNIQTVANVQTRNVETDYPNMSALTDVYPDYQVTELDSTIPGSNMSVYYHKKIRAEQVRSQRTYPREPQAFTDRLPRITDVFSQFSDAQYRSLTQPLYVQVGEDSGKIPPYPPTSSAMLECVYNFRRAFLPLAPTPPPLVWDTHTDTRGVYTTPRVDTRCVYTTPVITTAIAHAAAAPCNDRNTHSTAYQRDSQQYNVEVESVPRLYDYLREAEQEQRDLECEEVLSSSRSSFGTTSSQLGANVTIPEMVEDALELISQDGDYMERIEMDVRMQCILCEWAGPKIILEYHIRKEHSSEIVQQDGTEWTIMFTLGALVASETWLSKVVQCNGNIYVVSAKYMDVDSLMATLTVLSTESDEVPNYSRIAVYNKVTGEPHVWEGEITYLPDTMPYHTDGNGLKLDVTRLDLLPNSANLKLVNGELVVNSSAKVVVGQPELNSIEIAVYVKVFNKIT